MTDHDRAQIQSLLAKQPPGSLVNVTSISQPELHEGRQLRTIDMPEVALHCDSEECGREMKHKWNRLRASPREFQMPPERLAYTVCYECNHCEKIKKVFALLCEPKDAGFVLGKIGELPEYGPPTPARLHRLLQDHRDLFKKGRQCEIHNQGIGAFAYYRRIVEDSKNEILSAIIEVARLSPNNAALVKELEGAKQEIQFKKAIEGVRAVLPDSLLIDGENPLQVLHIALSVGIHELSDSECLERSTLIREVLIALAERVAEFKADRKSLSDAVKSLRSQQKKPNGSKA